MLLILVSAVGMNVNAGNLSGDEKYRLMKQYNAEVRAGTEMIWNGLSVPTTVSEHCDSLRYLLYADTVSVPLSMQVISRLTVETFNIASGNGKTDYHQIVVALNSCKKVPAFYDKFFLASSIGLGEHKIAENDDRQAIAAFSLALKCVQHPQNAGKYESFSPWIYLNLGYANSRIGNFGEAAEWQALYADELLKTVSPDSTDYIAALSILGSFQRQARQDDNASATYQKVCGILEDAGKTDTDDYIEALLARAEISDDETLYDRLLKVVPTRSESFVGVLTGATMFYHKSGNKEKVSGCLDRLFEGIESGETTPDALAGIFPVLDSWYMDSRYGSKALELIKNNYDRGDIGDCATLAIAYSKCGEYENAVREADNVRRMADDALAREDKDISLSFSNVIQMFVALNDFGNAVRYLKLSLPYVEKAFGASHPELVDDHIKLLASYHAMNGDVNESKRIIELLLARESVSGENKVELLLEFINALHGVGDYEGVDRYCNELLACDLTPDEMWNVLTLKISALVCWLDSTYDRNGEAYESKKNELAETVTKCQELVLNSYPNDVEKRIYSGLYSATLGFLSDDNDAMLRAADNVEDIVRKQLANSSLRDTYLSSLAMYYVKAGDYKKAIKLLPAEKASNDIEAIYDYQILAEAYLGLGKVREAQKAYGELAGSIISEVGRKLAMFTEKDKEHYWRMYERQIADAGRYAEEGNDRSEFGGVVYDLALNSKGLLLNSAKTFSDIVGKSKDPQVTELYEMWQSKRNARTANLTMSDQEKTALDNQIKNIELSLNRLVPESNVLLSGLSHSWKDIQSKLTDDDIAIEFLELQDIDYSREYAAVLISRKLHNPVFVRLGKVEDIDNAISTEFSASAVWNKLLPYMTVSGSVYFSPSGNLNCLPIESLLLEDQKPISSAYSMYRLSSTRVLLEPSGHEGRGIALFGGIDFGNGKKNQQRVHRGVAYSLPYLPGTKREMDMICRIADSTDKNDIKAYEGLEGTETNLRNLSGNGVKVLHIGTHGYFVPSTDRNYSRMPYSARKLYNAMTNDVSPMVNSGLFLANANIVAEGENQSSDDGIVTAYEISGLDFSGMDLVVLSACETGLGQLSGDGVFGLQRGFKLAGVNSIIMTLNKVDDDITCDFMSRLYTDYFAGKSKADAFRAAQEMVRLKYSDNKCWSSFILLDAVADVM